MNNELRIGNWVYDVDRPHQIIGIDSITVELLNPSPYTASHPQLWEFIKPIPLSEEWLVKAGLIKVNKKEDLKCFYSNAAMKIQFIVTLENGILFNGQFFHFIKTVHQFQNWYYSNTGEELEFKL